MFFRDHAPPFFFNFASFCLVWSFLYVAGIGIYPVQAQALGGETICYDLDEDLPNKLKKVWRQYCLSDKSKRFSVSKKQMLSKEIIRSDKFKDHLLRLNKACSHNEAENHTTLNGDFLNDILGNAARRSYVNSNGGINWSDFAVGSNFVVPSGVNSVPIKIRRVIFCDDVNLQEHSTKFSIALEQSVVLSKNNSNSNELGLGRISLWNSDIDSVRIYDVHLGVLDARWIKVSRDFTFDRNKFGHAVFINARIGGELSMENTTQTNNYYSLYDGPKPPGLYGPRIDLTGVQVGSQLDIDQVNYDGILRIVRGQLGGIEARCSRFPALDWRRMHVRRNILLANSTLGFENNEFLNHCEVNSVPRNALGGLLLMDMKIDGSLFFQKETECKAGDTSSLPQRPVTVVGQICLSRTDVRGDLDLSGAMLRRLGANQVNVAGSLIFAGKTSSTSWNPQDGKVRRHVDLRGSTVGILRSCFVSSGENHGVSADWPSDRLFESMNVRRMAVVQCNENGEGGVSLRSRDSSIDRLTKFLSDGNYRTEGSVPYFVFEQSYRRLGFTDQAGRLKFAGEAHKTRESSWANWPYRIIQLFFGGYGVDPAYPFFVALSFVFVGTWALGVSQDAKEHFKNRKPKPNTCGILHWIEMFICSLDRLIPVFTLSKEHTDLKFDNSRFIRIYFHIHGFVGWLLASMVVLFFGRMIGISSQ